MYKHTVHFVLYFLIHLADFVIKLHKVSILVTYWMTYLSIAVDIRWQNLRHRTEWLPSFCYTINTLKSIKPVTLIKCFLMVVINDTDRHGWWASPVIKQRRQKNSPAVFPTCHSDANLSALCLFLYVFDASFRLANVHLSHYISLLV